MSEKDPIGTNATMAVNNGAAKISSAAIIDRFQLALKLESIGVTKKVEATTQKLIDAISSRILLIECRPLRIFTVFRFKRANFKSY